MRSSDFSRSGASFGLCFLYSRVVYSPELLDEISTEQSVKVKVTKEGVMIPRELLDGFDEAEVIRENGRIVVIPKVKSAPIFEFGKHPVRSGIRDASVNLDHYLYGKRANV